MTSNRSDGNCRDRISCYAAQDTTTCAAFIKESRMKFVCATNLNRKSGSIPQG
jgi:hypothetical protein